MSSHFKTFLHGSAISLIGTGVFGILNYFVRRTLCNNMPLADYGFFYGTLALYSIVYALTDLGLTQSGPLMIASASGDPEKRDSAFSHLFFVKSVLVILSACGIFLVTQIKQPGEDVLFQTLFLIYFSANIMLGTLQSLWVGQKKYAIQQIVSVSIAVLMLCLLNISGNLSLITVSCCFMLPVVSGLVFGVIYSRFSGLGALRMRFEKPVFRKLLTMGRLIAVTTTLLIVMYYMDSIMLGIICGRESVGLYNVALPIMQIVQSAMIFPAVFLPISVDMGKQKEYAKLLVFVRWAVGIAFIAAILAWLFFHYTGELLISFLFKPEYKEVAPAVTLLCLGMVFYTLGNFFFQIMLCLKKAGIMAVIAGCCAIINLILNVVLIHAFGIFGAAGATMTSYFCFAILTYLALELILRKIKKQESVFSC